MLKLRWTGSAGIEINDDGKIVLIDPYLTRLSKGQMLFGRHGPKYSVLDKYVQDIKGELSAIIVGHTHFDHAMDVPVLSRWCRGPVVGNRSLKTLMEISGEEKDVIACTGNERIELFNRAILTMIPSRHGRVVMGLVPYKGDIDPAAQLPMRVSQYGMGDPFMAKLEMGGTVFLHAGSAGLNEEQLSGHRCDVLLMCVAGWDNEPDYIPRLLALVQPEVIIPIHFDDFTRPIRPGGYFSMLPFQRLGVFMRRLKETAPRVSIRKPRPFQAMLV